MPKNDNLDVTTETDSTETEFTVVEARFDKKKIAQLTAAVLAGAGLTALAFRLARPSDEEFIPLEEALENAKSNED